MVIDGRTGTIVFPLSADLSAKKGIDSARESIGRLYRERRERYILPASYRGLNLLEHDAVIVITNTAGCVAQRELDNMMFFIEEIPIHVDKDAIILPYFNRSLYDEEVERDSRENPDKKPEEPQNLVYDDEIPFETLLCTVNRGK